MFRLGYRGLGLAFLMVSFARLLTLIFLPVIHGLQRGDTRPLRRCLAFLLGLGFLAVAPNPAKFFAQIAFALPNAPIQFISHYTAAFTLAFRLIGPLAIALLYSDGLQARFRASLNAVATHTERLTSALPRFRAVSSFFPDLLLAIRRPALTGLGRFAQASISMATAITAFVWTEQIVSPARASIHLTPASFFLLGEIAAAPYSSATLHLAHISLPLPAVICVSILAWASMCFVLIRAFAVPGPFCRLMAGGQVGLGAPAQSFTAAPYTALIPMGAVAASPDGQPPQVKKSNLNTQDASAHIPWDDVTGMPIQIVTLSERNPPQGKDRSG